MDAKYLESNVADALVAGLAATVQEQPADAVAFLGAYLVKAAATMRADDQRKHDDAQEEADRKQAAAKEAAEAKAAEPAVKAAKAAEKADEVLSSKLAAAAAVDEGLMEEVLAHVQSITDATGAYIAVKQPPAEGEDAAEDDESGADGSSLRYLAATEDHKDVLEQELKAPAGVTFPVWKLPAKEGDEEEEEEDEDEDGEPKAKPPPPELQPLHIRNVLKSTAEFYRIPRIGAYLAVPLQYNNLTHDDAIPPPEEKDDDADADGDDAGDESKAADESKEDVIPPGRAKQTQLAICVDTMGKNRPFTDAQIATVKRWADELQAALNRTQQAQYEVNFKRHREELAAAAAAAAEAAAKEADDGGD